MNRLREFFGRPRVILPVIHVADERQALRNAHIASDAGADGVFLINHRIPAEKLLRIQATVVDVFPRWWIGVNCLDLNPDEVFCRISPRVAGVWTDNAMIREDREQQDRAKGLLAVRQDAQWSGLYFGGVAFKGQRPVTDVAAAACIARNFMDVVTTSGPGTGRAASLEKIRTMKLAIGDFPLAIASGITPDNVESYLPYADCFLVATGISRSFEELDFELVQRLVAQVHAYEG